MPRADVEESSKLLPTPIQARISGVSLLRLRYKRKFILLTILFVLVGLVQFVFPNNLGLASLYNSYIFRPFQSLRNTLFSAVPFSVGDVLYLIAFLAIITVLVRWIYFLVRIRTAHHELAQSVLNSIISLGIVYLLFFVGWGGNYYNPTLSKFWKLSPVTMPVEPSITAYDSFLIDRLNSLAPDYKGLPFKTTNKLAKEYYKTLVSSKTRLRNMRSKASLYGYFMQYMGIQGYYNPFTGEAQVNNALPEFMLPFVVCHEMAHQSGIAAEDDANLLSYAICVSAKDSSFNYSGYFNLWLYAQNRLKQLNPAAADTMFARLNTITKAQVDTLRKIRMEYRSAFSEWSGALYDTYLKLHNQKDGIKSYNNVVLSAYEWETRRKQGKEELKIP